MTDATRANVALLAFCQALSMTGLNILVTTSSLVGHSLLEDKAFATLPMTLQVTGTMLSTIPASLLMARIGRRAGFTVGALIGLAGAALATLAIFRSSFALFCCGTALLGSYAGFAVFYRFAAADTASEAFRPKAVSLVMAGGIVAAVFGPELAKWSRDLFGPVLFAGCYVVVAVLCLAAVALLQFIRIPKPPRVAFGAGRPLTEIVRSRSFIVAALCGMIGYGVMNLVMTATPLAMVDCGLAFEQAAFVIQWHVLGMFAPSFFTGSLIGRFGAARVMACGALLLVACVVVNLSGTDVAQFWTGLVLLGLGWNFLFVGASTLLTTVYAPAERAKVQALNDFLVFGMVSATSFSSGVLLAHFGWMVVNLAVLPLIGVALIAALAFAGRSAGAVAAPARPT
jgi:MFS family permease